MFGSSSKVYVDGLCIREQVLSQRSFEINNSDPNDAQWSIHVCLCHLEMNGKFILLIHGFEVWHFLKKESDFTSNFKQRFEWWRFLAVITDMTNLNIVFLTFTPPAHWFCILFLKNKWINYHTWSSHILYRHWWSIFQSDLFNNILKWTGARIKRGLHEATESIPKKGDIFRMEMILKNKLFINVPLGIESDSGGCVDTVSAFLQHIFISVWINRQITPNQVPFDWFSIQ